MIVIFDREYIAELNSRYQYGRHTQILHGNRFYTATISINGTPFVVCIPLHSNCRANYISLIPPNSDSHWRTHGLEYGKMLLLKAEDIQKHAYETGIDRIVWEDILRKQETILKRVKDYILEILTSMDKRDRGLNLSRHEQNNLNYSTLNCFPQYITELKTYIIPDLIVNFTTYRTITELVLLKTENQESN